MSSHLIGRITAFVAAAVLLTSPALAQRPGAIELGAFGRYTLYDNNLGLKEAFGGGALLGVFIVPNLSFEAMGAYTPVSDTNDVVDVTHVDLAGRLVYHLPLAERFGVHLGVGYGYQMYSTEGQDGVNDHGPTGLFGLRIRATPAVSIRGEAFANYIMDPENGADQNFTWGGQLGLTYTVGAVSDMDKDGVADDKDACPDTPAGVVVDAQGCPVDTDKDGVADYLDKCPNTPAGATVDAQGCPVDTDKDGVADYLDKCPNTPAGEAVDAAGCSLDADKDGVPDARDQCPDTPAGQPVNRSGCPLDSDGDGVADNLDKCPDTPAGATVDAAGCPLDGDKDGVPDGIDKCPNTAAGTRVDATGCPMVFEEGTTRVVLQGVTFQTGSAQLTPAARAILDGVAQTLAANPDIKVEVGGHTDSTGSRATNVRLSQARAESVMAYLVGKGVAASRLTAKGYGPDEPVADNKTADGRAKNRRVELRRAL
jgi:outer membrane protein OmpA-like peptidoglycan-associated protein